MKIAFFTNSFNRTGSETALLHLLRSINNTGNVLITNSNGSLKESISECINTYSYADYKKGVESENHKLIEKNSRILFSIYNRIYRFFKKKNAFDLKIANYENFTEIIQKEGPFDLWYVNSMVLPQIVFEAKRKQVKCIVHWHEWEDQLIHFTREEIRALIDYPELIIANSKLTADFITQLGRKKPIEICYEPVESKKIMNLTTSKVTRESLGISKESFIWTMSGAIDTRKNASLFIEIAKRIVDKKPNTLFFWLGGGLLLNSAYMEYLRSKEDYYNLEGKIYWIGEQNELYYDYLKLSDGFVSTATIETFSIVSCEALALGIPYVGYDCGGTNEYISSEAGILLNSNKPDIFCDALMSVMTGQINFNPEVSKAIAMTYDVENFVSNWKSIMHRNNFI
jgi:glycosyltransferase involved in cell wall biosynthesis